MSQKQRRLGFLWARDKPAKEKRSMIITGNWDEESQIIKSGYVPLSKNPEVVTAIDRIASLVGAMTVHLLEATDKGDVRIKNGISRIVDIRPNPYMTRSALMHWIVKELILHGNAVVLPVTSGGYLERLDPIPYSRVSFLRQGRMEYKILIDGVTMDPRDVLHFVVNPEEEEPYRGEGFRVVLRSIVDALSQASETGKAFMSSKWKPPIIIRVDTMNENLASPEGRSKILEDYVKTNEAGEPWILPAESMSVESVKPLTLQDLALADFVKLDRSAVASIIGIPGFVLGVGAFGKDEWNNFIATKVMHYGQIIQQELTEKLLYSPSLYFRFNPRSLYTYDLKELATIGDEQYVRGIMTGNEVRDWLGMSPKEGLDELVLLENYIPREKIGDQKKLWQGGEDDGES